MRLPCAYLDGNNWTLVFYLKGYCYHFRSEIREITMCISRMDELSPGVLS